MPIKLTLCENLKTKESVQSLFTTCGYTINWIEELANQYWPRCPQYSELIFANPWWLVSTDLGIIEIGPRKRVIHIQWDKTNVRKIVTDRDVTKGDTYVHAYTVIEIIEALVKLRLSE